MNHVQGFCYDDPRFTKSFTKFVTLLYKVDVVSENAVRFWVERGAVASKGKGIFMKQMEGVVRWMNEAEEETEEEAKARE